MKNKIILSATACLVVVISLVGFASKAAPSPLERKIVVFEQGVANKAEIVSNAGGKVIKDLPLVNGMAVMVSAKALERKAGVLRVENDDLVFAVGRPFCNYNEVCEPNLGENPSCSDCKNGEEEPPAPPSQVIDWGVDRIDADLVWDTNKGQGVRVAVIDSGIDSNHPDLLVSGGYNTINPRKSWNDDNGHGTHVAGIVAALDNEIGVIGVAPMADLYAVKVLNRQGVGFTSDVIEGLYWAIENGMQVANMSIGSSGCSETYHDAIKAAKDEGITIAAAAGNNGETDGSIVCPAKWPETIAVSATKQGDELASFSSWGEEIDLAAPGYEIKSTWNNGDYYVANGTSMATPHVAGVAALVIASGKAISPDDVINLLKGTAESIDMGSSCPTTASYCQGAGLVDAQAAVE